MKSLNKLALVVAFVVGTVNAQAAAVDVTAVVTAIGEVATPIGLIASGVLLIHLAVKAFKWIRAAMA